MYVCTVVHLLNLLIRVVMSIEMVPRVEMGACCCSKKCIVSMQTSSLEKNTSQEYKDICISPEI